MFWIDEPGPGSRKSQNRSDTFSGKGAGAAATVNKPNEATGASAQKSGGQAKRPEKVPKKPGIFLLFFGVFLPLAAALIEFNFHVCAQIFFDPFPTTNHFFLFLLIPLTNFMAFLSGRLDMSEHYGFMALASGMSVGIAILYSLMFLPLMPLSLIAILFLGFGLLGLSPMFSIPATMSAGGYVCHRARLHQTFFDAHHAKHFGHLIILVTVIAVELPSTLTRIHLAQAANMRNPAMAHSAVQWLRNWGNQEVMLRACYERSGRATDIVGSLYESQHPLNIEDARRIFYKVTGKPFNSVPLPTSARASIQKTGLIADPDGLNSDVQDEFDLDPDIAGETVSGVARGLSLSKSVIKGNIDSQDAVADLTWTFALNNSSKLDREARVKVQLPPGAVLTHAYVTIDDREREAVIMGRSEAREVYHQAVIEHRNPMLVSTCGPDQILMQCYPVRPDRETAIRLIMAAPLELSSSTRTGRSANLSLPCFAERNFQADSDNKLNISSPSPFSLNATALELKAQQSGQKYSLEADLDNSQLSRLGTTVRINDWGGHKSPIEYRFPRHITIVVDGSASMAPHLEKIALQIMGPLSASTSDSPLKRPAMSLCFVGDEVKTFANVTDATKDDLKKLECRGGQDNSLVLAQLSRQMSPSNPILWIHGSQPVVNSHRAAIFRSRLQLFRRGPVLYDMQVASGPNEILSGMNSSPLDASAVMVRVNDLSNMYNRWVVATPDASGGVPASGGIRAGAGIQERAGMPVIPASGQAENAEVAADGQVALDRHIPVGQARLAHSASQTVLQLNAYQDVLRRLQAHPDDLDEQYEAAAIAVRHHLITPVTSGVVDDVIVPTPVQKTEGSGLYESLNQLISRDIVSVARAFPIASLLGSAQSMQSMNENMRYEVESEIAQAPAAIAESDQAAERNIDLLLAKDGSAGNAAPDEVGAIATEKSQDFKENKTELSANMAKKPGRHRRDQVRQKQKSDHALKFAEQSLVSPSAASQAASPHAPTFNGNKSPLDLLAPKVVPESDTWILLGIAFIVLSGGLFFRFRPAVPKA